MLIELQGVYETLKKWKRNPKATKREIGVFSKWKEDSLVNDFPLLADEINKMKEFLKSHNPSSYYKLFWEERPIFKVAVEFLQVLFTGLFFFFFCVYVNQNHLAIAILALVFLMYYKPEITTDILVSKKEVEEYNATTDETTRKIMGIYSPTTTRLIKISVVIITTPLIVSIFSIVLYPIFEWTGIFNIFMR